ncbi:MAG: hypothetical protein WA745_06580, partial [Methylovirgula sp.]
MKRILLVFLAVAAATAGGVVAFAQPFSVLGYHGGPDRSGHFIVPNLSWNRARSLHFDSAFHAELSGQLYAQPLYWRPADSRPPMLIAVTESNVVHALDARTGHELWKRELGTPVKREALPCGDIAPLGITGTPVI